MFQRCSKNYRHRININLLKLQLIDTPAFGCIELKILLFEFWITYIIVETVIIAMDNQRESLDLRFMGSHNAIRNCVTSYALSKVAKLYGMSEHGVQEWLKSKKPIMEHIGKYQGQMSKSQLQSIQCDEPQPQPKSKVKIRRYDIYLKYEAVMDYERINSVKIVSKKHGLSETVLYRWLRNARRIKETYLSRTGEPPHHSSSTEQPSHHSSSTEQPSHHFSSTEQPSHHSSSTVQPSHHSSSTEQLPQHPNIIEQSSTYPMSTEQSSIYHKIMERSSIYHKIMERSSIYPLSTEHSSIHPNITEQSSILTIHPSITEQTVDSADNKYQEHDTQSVIGNGMLNGYPHCKLINQQFIF